MDYIKLLVWNMIDIFNKQNKVEDEIRKYTVLCNKYLVGKKVIYCEKNMEIKLEKNGNKLSFNSLSSGEKQIISLFAKLYLAPLKDVDWNEEEKFDELLVDKKYWIIFDEPELSLSVEWQSSLLIDIWNSNRCGFLFVTTHSPFIFKNNMRYSTSDIRSFICESKNG